MKPIFCGNFDYDAREPDVERLFRKYGKVDRVDMKSGFAFIYMEDERDAEDAIRALDRTEFGRKGRRLRVEWTKQERDIRKSGGSRRSSANTKPSKTLFVINFDPRDTRPKDLEKHFESYGKIANVRIRRNFAFVQYEFQEDATRALEATNMSKLLDQVISVEYAARDDDERRNRHSPNRGRDRSPDRRGYDRRRSPSPYGRERGSPDYGHGHDRKERASPDYGRGPRGHSPSPYKRDRPNSDLARAAARSPSLREREKASPEDGHREREKASPENGRAANRSPYRRERLSPGNGKDITHNPNSRERRSSENGPDRSPSPDNGRALSPDSRPETRDSPGSQDNEKRYRGFVPTLM
ncbi:serine/arginine-rich splicing factor RS31-like [Rutidosis leptorrhynchoides]|uniref:serine/arginine-rich splicing factor RS31-like n=1 Tax=Rutidosis leptorrhynchoides TaxID=125765 RepID=UPI003A9A35F1